MQIYAYALPHFSFLRLAVSYGTLHTVASWAVTAFLITFARQTHDMQEFRIKEYGRMELAMMYSPGIAPESAWRKLKRWMQLSP